MIQSCTHYQQDHSEIATIIKVEKDSILLGGHQAQTSEFTGILLTDEEKVYLEQENAQKIFLKPDGFSQGQIVIIVTPCHLQDHL